MKKTIAALVGATVVLAANAASAGVLTNVSVSLSDSRVSRPTDVTIRYTTATTLDAPSLRRNLLIATFGGLAMTDGDCGADVTFTVNGAPLAPAALSQCSVWGGNNVQFRLAAGASVAAGSNVEIVIDSARVTTTATSGLYGATTFRTAMDSGAPIDTPATQPTYFISTPPPASVPTLTEWAMILLTAALGGFAVLTIHRRRQGA
jgi:hypothetical protein